MTIEAPSNVFMTDVEYGLDLYMTGKIEIDELRSAFPDTVMIDQEAADTLLDNPTLLKISSDANNVSPETFACRVRRLLETENA
jgi:hypothetical protein